MVEHSDALGEVRPGAVLRGLIGQEPVTIVSVTHLTQDSMSVVYRTERGALGERMVFASDAPRLEPVDRGAAFTFDADPKGFILAAEARRMRLAHLFDSQQALGTSDVDPLPHQLRAVYEEMLPRRPLRFVLADDPGAGKTIMCGLLVKELLLRGDALNVLIVAPGSLVDQWQDEMEQKFALSFQLLTKDLTDAVTNPFTRGGLWLARMDVLARNTSGILDKACDVDWDLIVFDEAHKMSASVFGSEVKKTKRYQMAERLGANRNLLLMTATPHSGKEEQFQLFMALLDADRFEGAVREGTRRVDVSDMMRRMVKEELLRFDGTRLFPERRSYTVQYPLTDAERALYANVTEYVRDQMNLAQRAENDGRKRVAVGFALTTLQRRLASSPAAIHKSLERRLKRLEIELREAQIGVRVDRAIADIGDLTDVDLDDLTDEERERLEDEVTSAASAATSIEELQTEILALTPIVEQARLVRSSPSYSKWDHMRETLDDSPQMRDESGARRKVIIFTEHKDTLDDIVERLRNHIGRDDAIAIIHGAVRREDRKKAQERFKTDDSCIFLVATDAAGEGVNLQNAHLVVNFDLPWNPNRIEQRFGRVHRIGQRYMCHMWSLVAKDTREGDVYLRLLEKLEQQRSALGGRVYDVLGTVFDGSSLRDLMIQAIMEGDSEEAQAALFEVVDARVGDGIAEVLAADQLVPTMLTSSEIDEVREEMERAEAARLQPYHVEQFFAMAFEALGGSLRTRESHRYELRSVPAAIKEQDRIAGGGVPVMDKYSRITFDRKYMRVDGHASEATLMHPGHPLMTAMLSVVGDRYGDALRRGAILVDHLDVAVEPYVVCLLEHDVTDGRTDKAGHPLIISRKVQYIRVDSDGAVQPLGQTPLPNLEIPTAEEEAAALRILGQSWARSTTLDEEVVRYASSTVAREHLERVAGQTVERVEKTRRLVRDRLGREITFWDRRAAEIRENERAGRNSRLPADQAQSRAEELARRLDRRLAELALEESVAAAPPRIAGALLVVTEGWLNAQRDPDGAAAHARETQRIERIAVDAVLKVERSMQHSPVEKSHNNPGYDIESRTPKGLDFIEVKGRIDGADVVSITRQEIVTSLMKGERSVLAMVRVHNDDSTEVRYLRRPMTEPLAPGIAAVQYKWDFLWEQARIMSVQYE